MMKSLILNRRRRGAVGATLGAVAPYAFWASENGVTLSGDPGLMAFVMMISAFFAVIGFGVFHGGVGQPTHIKPGRSAKMRLGDIAKTHQSGKFAWMREVHSRHR